MSGIEHSAWLACVYTIPLMTYGSEQDPASSSHFKWSFERSFPWCNTWDRGIWAYWIWWYIQASVWLSEKFSADKVRRWKGPDICTSRYVVLNRCQLADNQHLQYWAHLSHVHETLPLINLDNQWQQTIKAYMTRIWYINFQMVYCYTKKHVGDWKWYNISKYKYPWFLYGILVYHYEISDF